MLSSVFIFSALLLWGFPSLPSAQHCHRLEFKFSKHFSEAGLRKRNNIDWVTWISKEGTKQKLFGEWRLAKLKNKQNSSNQWNGQWRGDIFSASTGFIILPSSYLTLGFGMLLLRLQFFGFIHWGLTQPIRLFLPRDQLCLWGLFVDFTHIRPHWLSSLSVVRFCTRSGPDTRPFTSTSPLISSGNMTTAPTSVSQ